MKNTVALTDRAQLDPAAMTTHHPYLTISLVAKLIGSSVQDVKHKVIIALLFTKNKIKENTRKAQPWYNKTNKRFVTQ